MSSSSSFTNCPVLPLPGLCQRFPSDNLCMTTVGPAGCYQVTFKPDCVEWIPSGAKLQLNKRAFPPPALTGLRYCSHTWKHSTVVKQAGTESCKELSCTGSLSFLDSLPFSLTVLPGAAPPNKFKFFVLASTLCKSQDKTHFYRKNSIL